jgi:hypothetical protein
MDRGFNLLLDPSKDSKYYVIIDNPRAREKVLELCVVFDLIDIWCKLYIETEEFTWCSQNLSKKVDLFLSLFLEIFFQVYMSLGYILDIEVIIVLFALY